MELLCVTVAAPAVHYGGWRLGQLEGPQILMPNARYRRAMNSLCHAMIMGMLVFRRLKALLQILHMQWYSCLGL
jgi:hypothetical protein